MVVIDMHTQEREKSPSSQKVVEVVGDASCWEDAAGTVWMKEGNKLPIPPVPVSVERKTSVVSETILEEAQRLVHGNRGTDYGEPIHDFGRTALIWEAIFGHPVTPEQVALCMVGVKISREVNCPKRDNRVDGAGYFETLDMIHQKRAKDIEAQVVVS